MWHLSLRYGQRNYVGKVEDLDFFRKDTSNQN